MFANNGSESPELLFYISIYQFARMSDVQEKGNKARCQRYYAKKKYDASWLSRRREATRLRVQALRARRRQQLEAPNIISSPSTNVYPVVGQLTNEGKFHLYNFVLNGVKMNYLSH
jgi:hypothetical protein